ncbi:MAG: hypothetical protein F7C35_08970 [Desulfurococcales archaeon]|nr:hypothetical protein [Desulfurococcales archaeon]
MTAVGSYPCNTVRVEAGARLHGGFHRVPSSSREWAGLGFYIQEPRTIVEAGPAREESVEVDADPRVAGTVERAIKSLGVSGVRIRVVESIPRHVGLGSTTQTVLSSILAAMILKQGGKPGEETLLRAAVQAGRGRVSGVGTLLFLYGGFIVEAGKKSGIPVPMYRAPLPDDWMFIVILPEAGRGLPEGRIEDSILDNMPPAGDDVLGIMERGTYRMLRALALGDVDMFLDGLSMVQTATGKYFSKHQGGTYRRDIATLADEARRDGIILAQSSWGPTLYTITTRDRVESDLKTLKMIMKLTGVRGKIWVTRARKKPATAECATQTHRLGTHAVRRRLSKA